MFAMISVAFYCLDTYNTGTLHYAEMFHFYQLLFGDAVDDDCILQLAAAAVLRGSSDVDNPVGITFKDFDKASAAYFCSLLHCNTRLQLIRVYITAFVARSRVDQMHSQSSYRDDGAVFMVIERNQSQGHLTQQKTGARFAITFFFRFSLVV